MTKLLQRYVKKAENCSNCVVTARTEGLRDEDAEKDPALYLPAKWSNVEDGRKVF